MILYSITINVDKEVQDEWLGWMKSNYVGSMLKTGLIIDNKILRLLNEEEGNPGVTYSFQFFLKNLSELDQYQLQFEESIDSELYMRYKNQFVEFRTILEVV